MELKEIVSELCNKKFPKSPRPKPETFPKPGPARLGGGARVCVCAREGLRDNPHTLSSLALA